MHTKALYANAVTMAATGSNSSNIAVSGRSEIPNPTQFQQDHKILENWLIVSWTNNTKTSGYYFDDEFIFIIGHFMKKRLRISFYFAYFYFLEWIAFLLLKFYFFSLYVWPWLCRKWRESNLFGRWIFKFIIVHSFRFM